MGRKKGVGDKRKKKIYDEPEFVCTVYSQPEQPIEEQPIAEQPIGEQPLGEQPIGEHPIGEQSIREQSIREQLPEEQPLEEQPTRKRKRGPTRMKDIAKDPNRRVHVDFTFMGEHYGPGYVKLSSYLDPLVREHVPVTVEKWSKITEDVKTVLWKSVQVRFELDEDYQKTVVLKQMGGLWRSSKSRLVKKIREAHTNQQRMNMRPKNVNPTCWRKFVKSKTSNEFKVLSDSYKERRRKQIPHTCSRKGMVRLAEELKQESSDHSEVSRLKVWVKSRTRKDKTPVNTIAAEKIKKAAELVNFDHPSIATNVGQDTLSQLLRPDNPGRMKAMGRNITKTKLACFQVNHKCMAEMEENQIKLNHKVTELQNEIYNMKNQTRN